MLCDWWSYVLRSDLSAPPCAARDFKKSVSVRIAGGPDRSSHLEHSMSGSPMASAALLPLFWRRRHGSHDRLLDLRDRRGSLREAFPCPRANPPWPRSNPGKPGFSTSPTASAPSQRTPLNAGPTTLPASEQLTQNGSERCRAHPFPTGAARSRRARAGAFRLCVGSPVAGRVVGAMYAAVRWLRWRLRCRIVTQD